MKKIKMLFFGLLIAAFPASAYALTGNVNISCNPSTVNPGAEVQCSLTGTSDGVTTAFEADLNIPEGISPVSFVSTYSKWEKCSLTDDNSSIGCYANDTDISGNFDFGTLTFKVADSASVGSITISLTNVIFGDSDFHNVKDGITGGSATITVGNGSNPQPTETGLKTLVCSSGGVISPQLSDTNSGYSLFLNSADTNTFSITAEPKNSNDSVEFFNYDTNEKLDSSNITFKTTSGRSDMLIIINVGSGDSMVSYSVSVVKPNVKIGELSSLTVGNSNISLVSGVYDYDVELAAGTSFTIKANLADSENFVISNSSDVLNKTFTAAGDYNIVISPKNSSSGYGANTYIIHVSVGSSGNSSGGNVTPSNPTVNPKTGTTGAIFMAIVLVISLFVTLNLYKQNIAGYKK